MKRKIFIVVFLIITLIGLIYMVIVNSIFNKNKEIINEYIPEVEISDNELRKTLVTLYFVDADGKMKSEAKLVDSKELLRNPYIALIGMLLEGPKDSSLKPIIPEGTKIIDAKLNRKCVTVNLSKEFLSNETDDIMQKCNRIYTIVNTLTELNEVQSVKFLMDGAEVEGFEEEAIKLTNEFARTEVEKEEKNNTNQ